MSLPAAFDSVRPPRRRSRLHLLGMLAAAAFWLLESWLHVRVFPGGASFLAQLWPSEANELWMRVLVSALIIAFGFYARVRLDRERAVTRTLTEVLETTTDAFLAVDRDWRIVCFNDRATELLQRERDEVIGTHFWDSFPEAASHFFKALTQSLERGERRVVEGYCSGVDRYVELRTVPHESGMSLYFRDISERFRQQRELEAGNKRMRAILDSASDGIVSIDQSGIIETFNRSAERIFGWRANQAIGRNVSILMGADDAARHDGYLADYLRTGVSHLIQVGPREVTARRHDGSLFPAELAVGEMRLENERHFVGILRDITERKQAEEALRRSEASLARAQALARLGSWEWDIAAGTLRWSDEVFRIFGVEPGAFQPSYERFLEHVHPDDRGQVTAAVEAALQRERSYNVEHRIVLPDHHERVVLEQGEVSFAPDGTPLAMVGTLQDITERVEAQETIEFMANFDPLTGLPNRSLLQYRLDQGLQQARREGTLVGLLFIGIDRFKNINDTLGHSAGDAVLEAFGSRLAQSAREGDTVARLGGDEFAVVLFGLDDAEEAAQIARTIQDQARAPLPVEGHDVVFSASIGISLFPHDADCGEHLLRNADTALHRAKLEGPGSYQFFTADMTAESQARMRLEQDLRRALEREEFELFYQPQIELAGGRVIGVEALLRWRHPEHGLVSPGEFIPVLEETGLILPASRWVMQTACRQGRAWLDAGLPPVRIAVNLSALQFREPTLVEDVAQALADSGFAADRLELEITEGLLVENVEETIALLGRLHEMGVQISIDDFGTGYSSMSYLQRFPVHTLKLDRSFVAGVLEDEGSASIAKAVIALAHSLRLKVVAEGIETAAHEHFLRRQSCDEAQGFFYSRPLPTAELEQWLRQHGAGEELAKIALS